MTRYIVCINNYKYVRISYKSKYIINLAIFIVVIVGFLEYIEKEININNQECR